jgi:hypothetical protein
VSADHISGGQSLTIASLGDKDPSDTLVTPTTDESEETPPWASAISDELPPGLRRRKKVKGYCINSEDDRSGESDCPFSCSEAEDTQGCDVWEPPIPYDESSNTFPHSLEICATTNAPSTISIILPSLLPTSYVSDSISVSSGISVASSTFDTLTYHRELREAQLDSDFDRVIVKLAHEWYYAGASVSTTLFRSKLQELTCYPSYFPSQREIFFPTSVSSRGDSRCYYIASTRVYSASHPATSSWSTTLPNAR